MDIQSDDSLDYFGLCAAGMHRKLEFSKHSEAGVTNVDLVGHKSHVNACKFFPTKHNILCSTGDDNTLKIWDIEGASVLSSISLKSPGTVVDTHLDAESCVLVAEKSGTVKIFDLRSNTVVHRVHYDEPLLSAQWFKGDKYQVLLSAGNRLKKWSVGSKSNNFECVTSGNQNVLNIRYSTLPSIFAACDGSENIYIWNDARRDPIVKSLPKGASTNSLSWLYNEVPTLVAAANKSLYFFSLESEMMML